MWICLLKIEVEGDLEGVDWVFAATVVGEAVGFDWEGIAVQRKIIFINKPSSSILVH